jgi:hypothetical protein
VNVQAASLVYLGSDSFQGVGRSFRFPKPLLAAQDGADHLEAVSYAGVCDNLPMRPGVVVVSFNFGPESRAAQGVQGLALGDLGDFHLNSEVSCNHDFLLCFQTVVLSNCVEWTFALAREKAKKKMLII